MTQGKDISLSERLPADMLQRYQEHTRHFDEVAAMRGHSSATVTRPFDSLYGECPTGREIAVLQFIADGLTNKEIAARLSLSEETIKTYVQRTLAKLEARNRFHAVVLGYEQGWIGISFVEPEGWALRRPGWREFKLPTSAA